MFIQDFEFWLKIITANYKISSTTFLARLEESTTFNFNLLSNLWILIKSSFLLGILFYLSCQSHVSAIVRNPTCHSSCQTLIEKKGKASTTRDAFGIGEATTATWRFRQNLDQILSRIQSEELRIVWGETIPRLFNVIKLETSAVWSFYQRFSEDFAIR